MQQRDAVLQDIHGVADIIDETPELISSCLGRMEKEIQNLLLQFHNNNINNNSGSGNAATGSPVPAIHPYETALLQDGRRRQSTSTWEFRLSFLRAEQFQPQKAAERLLRYYEEKQRLFPSVLLARAITISDLDEEAVQHLECGRMQLLPERDRYVQSDSAAK
jgi:hypothetical protein